MEILKNSGIIVDIEHIYKVSGGDQIYTVFFTTHEGEHCKLTFDFVWDIICSIESGYIDRFYNFIHHEEEESCLLLIEESETVRRFKQQVSGTRPMDKVKNYILFDAIDTVIEVLSLEEPVLERLDVDQSIPERGKE